jgi:outer membrane lipoprotein-sorting protein
MSHARPETKSTWKHLLAVAGLLLSTTAGAVSPDESDPAAIMAAVENRDSGDKQVARLQITIRDKAGRERTRVVQSRSLDFEGGTKQLLIFESPADVRNAGLLSIDYEDGTATDDQWLYLPSLKRTTRISSSDKSGSFMGTDLTYADMTRKDPNAYEYTMVNPSETVDGEDCWVIEARPKTEKEKTETGYVKSHVWVSKSKLMAVQVKAWVISGKRLKYTQFKDIKQVEGIWMPHLLTVKTTRSGEMESQSILQFTDLSLNAEDVKDSDFTEQRLEQGL